jgi:hypothetical protein
VRRQSSCGSGVKLQAGAAAVFFTGFFLMASPSQAFFGIGWTTWLRDWVPQRLRGGYVGSRNRWMSVATIAYLLFIMGLFELGQDALWPFIVMIGVAMAMRIASLLHLHKIKTPRESSSAIASVGFVEALKTCMKAPGLVLFIVFSAWMNFWMGFTGPFVPVFCFEELKVHTAEFTLLVTLGTLTDLEQIVLLAGDDARFGGASGTNLSYDLTTTDQSVASGQRLIVQANLLRACKRVVVACRHGASVELEAIDID